MSFYPVIKLTINSIPTHVYVNSESLLWDPTIESSLSSHLVALHSAYKNELQTGIHHVVILWEMNNRRMTDIWIFGKKESLSSGPAVSVYTFQDMERYESPIVTAADGLVILGEEAKKFL